MNGRFEIDENRVVYEVLEGEVVVVNLDTGHYYILDNTAAAIWKQLANGTTPAEIVRGLCARHPAEGETVQEAVRSFVDQLTEEGLLTPSDRPVTGVASETAPTVDLGCGFVPPVLNRYTDMAKLIQMDPIHDFDETGWPRRPIARDR